MRDSRVRARYGVSVCRPRARVLTLFCPRTPSSWTGAPRTLSWPRPTGPRAGRPRRSPSRSAASGMNHRGTSLQVPTSLSTSSRLSCQGVLCLSSCCAGEAGLPKHGNVVRYFCLPQTKCHDGVGDGRETEEGRTCARGTGGFGKRESESESRSRHKVSGHSVGRGGAVRNTRTPPLSPRRPSRSAREASFRKWLQKHESLLLELLAPGRFRGGLAPSPPRPRKGTRTCGPDLTPYPYLYRFVRSPQPHVRDSRETVSQSSCA